MTDPTNFLPDPAHEIVDRLKGQQTGTELVQTLRGEGYRPDGIRDALRTKQYAANIRPHDTGRVRLHVSDQPIEDETERRRLQTGIACDNELPYVIVRVGPTAA